MSPTGGASQEIGAAGFEAGPTLHFPCFDAFRFFGMTMVLLVHAAFATRPWVQEHLPQWAQTYLERMDVGVAIFFVLSGFLLFRPFVARYLSGRPQGKTSTFLRRRSLRVLPGYWFALSFCVVFLGQILGSAKNAFLYYSLLFPFASQNVALGGGPGQEGNYAIPQAWSLTAEYLFYFMLPVVAILLVRLGAKKAPQVQVRNALLICLALYLFGQLFRLYFLLAEPSWARVAVIWAPNWVDFFAIGMATATYSAAHHAGMRLPSLLRFLGDHPAVSWCIAALVALSFATFSPPDTPGVYGAEYWVRWFLFGVFAFFLLAPAMFGDQTKGRGRRFLASKPLVLLGTVSLGFYLFHLAVMTNVQEWLAPAGTSSAFYGSLPAVFSLTFVGAVALAFLSYYLVEKPFLRLKDKPISSLWRRTPAKTRVNARPLVIIPAYNEEESLPAVLKELAEQTPECDVLVVSDGSTDRTGELAQAAGVRVAVLPFNLGIGGALRTGFAYAVRHGYERAVQFDADGQHDPLAVQGLLDGIDRGADMVIGSRFTEGGAVTYSVSGIRRQAMKLLQRLVGVLVGKKFTDTSSGFRAFSRPMLEYFAQSYPVEYMDSVEALVQACNAGFRVDEVPANMRGRTGGAPSTRNFKLVYYYVRLLVVLLVSTTSRGQRERRSARRDEGVDEDGAG